MASSLHNSSEAKTEQNATEILTKAVRKTKKNILKYFRTYFNVKVDIYKIEIEKDGPATAATQNYLLKLSARP